MTYRIKQRDLESLVERINEITNSPKTYGTRDENGFRSHIDHYHLDYAYGGVKMVRAMNDGGGIDVISTGGYGTKRELFNWLHAFISGLTNN